MHSTYRLKMFEALSREVKRCATAANIHSFQANRSSSKKTENPLKRFQNNRLFHLSAENS